MRYTLFRFFPLLLVGAGVVQSNYIRTFPNDVLYGSDSISTVLPVEVLTDGKGSVPSLRLMNRVLTLGADWADVPDWGAKVAVRFPLLPSRKPIDYWLFNPVVEYRTTGRTSGVRVSAVSALSPHAEEGMMPGLWLPASSSWKRATIRLDAMTYPTWLISRFPEDTALHWDSLKTQLLAFQFEPTPNYSSGGDSILGTNSGSLEIRSIGLDGYFDGFCGDCRSVVSIDSACTELSRPLSDFNGAQPRRNSVGGAWKAWTDSSETSELRRGGSVLEGGDLSVTDGWMGIRAVLDKIDVNLHPVAGRSGLNSLLPLPMNLDGLKGISFKVRVDSGTSLDDLALQFRIGSKSVDFWDWRGGPLWNLVPGKALDFCVDVAALTAPVYSTSGWDYGLFGWLTMEPKPIELSDIASFQWWLEIDEDSYSTRTSSGGFALSEVKLWSKDGLPNFVEPIGVKNAKSEAKSELVASYAGALRLSYALKDAPSAKVEVLQMDGRSVASFEAPSSVQAQAFPVTLGLGAYLAVVRSGSIRLVAPFVVAR